MGRGADRGRDGGRGRGVAGVPEQWVALGEAEVQHLGRSAGREHDVAGLEIAMHDAALVGRLDRGRDLAGERQRLALREGAAREPGGKRLAAHQLEHEVGRPVHLFEPVDRADVGVVERRERLRLASEAGQALRVGGELARQQLDRHVA